MAKVSTLVQPGRACTSFSAPDAVCRSCSSSMSIELSSCCTMTSWNWAILLLATPLLSSRGKRGGSFTYFTYKKTLFIYCHQQPSYREKLLQWAMCEFEDRQKRYVFLSRERDREAHSIGRSKYEDVAWLPNMETCCMIKNWIKREQSDDMRVASVFAMLQYIRFTEGHNILSVHAFYVYIWTALRLLNWLVGLCL